MLSLFTPLHLTLTRVKQYVGRNSVNRLTAVSSVAKYCLAQWKWKSLSHVWLFATLWNIQFMEFSRPEYWSLSLLQGICPKPGIEPKSLALQADSLPVEPQGTLCIFGKLDFPSGSDGKASACNVGDPGLIPRSGRSTEGNAYSLQYFSLENSIDRGVWWV